MNTTVPAPVTHTAARPGCPYEALRLGLGLRARDSARLTFLIIATALWSVACGHVDTSVTWYPAGQTLAPAGHLDTYTASEGCGLLPFGVDAAETEPMTSYPTGEPVQIWQRTGAPSCTISTAHTGAK